MKKFILALAALSGLIVLANAQQITSSSAPLPSLTGDCSLSGTAITCTKTGGVSLGTAATSTASTFMLKANNLSDLSSAATSRTNLGLAGMATQSASAIAITGGAIDGTTLGATTASSVKATTLAHSGVSIDTSYSYQQPTNLFSITPAAGIGRLILDPAGTLAAGTIIMPASPVDGQLLVINSSQIVTALTLSANAGQSILGALSTIALGGRIECIYRASSTTWYC